HLALVPLQQDLAGLDDVGGLGLVQAYGLDSFAQPVLAHGQDALGRAVLREEAARGQVDRFVGGLGGQDDGDQQLEGAVVFQLRGGLGIGGLEAAEDFVAFGGVHGVIQLPAWPARRARARARAAAMEAWRLSAWSASLASTGLLA